MITKLRVTNFKSLKDVSLALTRRNVFIGPNMSGKSNLLSVFRFLRQMVISAPGLYGLPNAVSNQGGFAELAWRGDESNLISVSLEGDTRGLNQGQEQRWFYDLELLGDRVRNSVRVHKETLRVLNPKGEEHPLIRIDRTGTRELVAFSGMHISRVDDFSRSALEFEIPDWEGNVFRRMCASFQFYHLIPQWMKQVNVFSAPGLLDEGGSNLSAWLMLLQTRHSESFDRIIRAVRDVLPDIANLLTWPAEQARVFIASHEKHLRTAVPVWQMSDGQLCFLAFLSLIYAPEDYGGAVFCVEEPENHLHPKLIEALVALGSQRQQELGDRAGQVIITTHSPLLVDKCRVEDVVVVEKRGGATVCTRPSDKPQLQQLLTREEIGLGDLLYSGALGGD